MAKGPWVGSGRTSMHQEKAFILCRFARHSGLYQPWLDQLPFPSEIIEAFPTRWEVPGDAAIIVSHMHYRWEEIAALRRITSENRVPVLVLSDGILEYRNIFEHPGLGDGSIFQPIVGHKLACIGRGQARIIESWGNVGKCEIVGLPRLDQFLDQPPPPVQTSGDFRLLIATASTPAFDERQRQAVVESLQIIRQRFAQNELVDNRKAIVTWRLTDGLERDLGLPLPDPREERPSLSEAIDSSDAVIVTPSTVFLESVLKGRPTALLDFHNKPHYVPSAWMINAPKHLNGILYELAQPPAAKLLFQQTMLHDQVECLSPANPRMIRLITEMAAAGQAARTAGRPLELPPRMLVDESRGFAPVEPGFGMARLFPRNHLFRNPDTAMLLVELNLAISRLQGMPEENLALQKQFEGMKQHTDWLLTRNEGLHARNRDLRQRLRRMKAWLDRQAVDLGLNEEPAQPEE